MIQETIYSSAHNAQTKEVSFPGDVTKWRFAFMEKETAYVTIPMALDINTD